MILSKPKSNKEELPIESLEAILDKVNNKKIITSKSCRDIIGNLVIEEE
jgi:hypothetical protein